MQLAFMKCPGCTAQAFKVYLYIGDQRLNAEPGMEVTSLDAPVHAVECVVCKTVQVYSQGVWHLGRIRTDS